MINGDDRPRLSLTHTILVQGPIWSCARTPVCIPYTPATQDAANDVEGARASFAEGLRLRPDYAQLYHAWARLEARLLNWGALQELNERARMAFPAQQPSPSRAAEADGG